MRSRAPSAARLPPAPQRRPLAGVESKLREQWSPQQIAGRLRLEKSDSISHESIYQYIYTDKHHGGTLHQHLRSQKKRRKRYGSGRGRRGQIPLRRCISERPAIVQRRERIGDWEGDTIVGKGHQQAIVSLTERFSRFTLLHKVERATAPAVSAAIIKQLKPWAARVFTLTTDNGKEFTLHQQIAAALQVDYYFAHPYASWERGLNENTNGLVRQYCPKASDFSKLHPDDIEAIAQKLNHRPRKTLNYKTPFEVFFQIKKLHLQVESTLYIFGRIQLESKRPIRSLNEELENQSLLLSAIRCRLLA